MKEIRMPVGALCPDGCDLPAPVTLQKEFVNEIEKVLVRDDEYLI